MRAKERGKVVSWSTVFILVMLLAVSLLALYAWAKYRENNLGQSEAQVASWYFDLKDKDDISISSDESDFSLTRTDGNNDSIAEGKIAPGTEGYFEVRVDTRGTDVLMTYNLDIELTDCPQNLKFYFDEDKTQELKKIENAQKSTEDVKVVDLKISRYLVLDETKQNYVNKEHIEKLYWKWPLQTGDTDEDKYKNDLEDSKWANKGTMGIKITAIGKQVREQELVDEVIAEAINGSSNLKGKALKSVAFNTVEDTTSIIDASNGTTYADGWHYVSGNDIEGLSLASSYIVNYTSGEIIEFDSNVHRIVDNNLLCVKEGLVYSVDPKNMGNGNNWGDAILHNFNEGDANSGWTNNSLMFDGVDDGIEVADSSDYSNGITIEMYINWRGILEDSQIVQILMMKRTKVDNGFFMYISNGGAGKARELVIDIGGYHERFFSDILIDYNVPTYITYTFNPNIQDDKGVIYINSERAKSCNLGEINNLISTQGIARILIGSVINATQGKNTYPFNGEIYAARVYNRPLSQEEVLYNYNNTVNASN